MYEQLAYEHRADLLRAAAAGRAGARAVSRAGRARPRVAERAARWLRAGLHRPVVARGCQA